MKWIKNLFSVKTENNSSNLPIINQTVNVGDVSIEHKKQNSPIISSYKKSKGAIQILFIDDNKVGVISVIKKAGYSSVKKIKDCNNIHCDQIQNADIIFVDVNGVGLELFPHEQGFGLAKAIKNQYHDKCIVLYSAEPQYFKSDYKILDSILPKNSEPYEFTKIIDDWNLIDI